MEDRKVKKTTSTRENLSYLGAYIPKPLYELLVEEAKKKTEQTYINHTISDIVRLVISDYFTKGGR